MPKEQKLDCTIRFSAETQFKATSHLIEHEYGRYKFWFGVAQVIDLNAEPPLTVAIEFEDGRKGGASLGGGRMEAGYTEVAFVGISALE